MITRIELTNFMSHKQTVIEPAAGLTVLVGPNNCGKSAVVAALQILCQNGNSTYVLRHGEKECSVKVSTNDGHTIQWRRKTSPSYLIDGQLFDRLRGSGTPETLQQVLRLPMVEGGSDEDFDVHFGAQKSPIFLLGSSSATAAKFFASSSDAIRLVEMQRRHKDKLDERKREKGRLEEESIRLNAERETLQPVVEIDRRLETTERLYVELLGLAGWLTQADHDETELRSQLAVVERREAEARALAHLASPPALTATEPLIGIIERHEQLGQQYAVSAAVTERLAELVPPPQLSDVQLLEHAVFSITEMEKVVRGGEKAFQSLRRLPEPPQLADTVNLESLIASLAAAEREETCQSFRSGALANATPPPECADEESLATLISALTTALAQTNHWEQQLASVVSLAAPPQPQDAGPLTTLVNQLGNAQTQASEYEQQLHTAGQELEVVTASLRELAASTVCPTCGSPLDADQLMTQAAGGLGGHSHE